MTSDCGESVYPAILEEWGLSCLIEKFAEEEISDDIFLKIPGNLLEALIPKIGLRARFVLKVEEYLSRHSFPLISTKNSDPFNLSGDIYLKASPRTWTPIIEDIQIIHSSTLPSTPPTSQEISRRDVDDLNLSGDQSLLQGSSISSGRSACATWIHELATHSNTWMSNFDLTSALNESNEGKIVLAHYAKEHFLSSSARASLVSAIVDFCILRHQKKLLNEELEELAVKIVSLFPSENVETYFVGPHTEGPTQKLAKGKLVHKYHNRKRQLVAAGVIGSERPTKKFASENPSPATSSTSDLDLPEDLQEHVRWLEHNKEPWPVVEAHWKATSQLRVGTASNDQTLPDLFESWPALGQPLGYSLIEIDFLHLYPGKKFVAYKVWPEAANRLIKVLKETVKDRKTQQLLATLELDSSADFQLLVVIKSLAAACPPIVRVRQGDKPPWKPTIVESQEGIILHAKMAGDINNLIQGRKDLAVSRQTTLQPLIIVQGATLQKLVAFYVCIDYHLYKFDSLLKALDICFKVYQVLNASYPPESEQVWLFVQRFFYEISTKYDKKISSVHNLIKKIGASSGSSS